MTEYQCLVSQINSLLKEHSIYNVILAHRTDSVDDHIPLSTEFESTNLIEPRELPEAPTPDYLDYMTDPDHEMLSDGLDHMVDPSTISYYLLYQDYLNNKKIFRMLDTSKVVSTLTDMLFAWVEVSKKIKTYLDDDQTSSTSKYFDLSPLLKDKEFSCLLEEV